MRISDTFWINLTHLSTLFMILNICIAMELRTHPFTFIHTNFREWRSTMIWVASILYVFSSSNDDVILNLKFVSLLFGIFNQKNGLSSSRVEHFRGQCVCFSQWFFTLFICKTNDLISLFFYLVIIRLSFSNENFSFLSDWNRFISKFLV